MNLLFSSVTLLFVLVPSLIADETTYLEVNTADSVTWNGESGYIYFLQWSTDLEEWDYWPSIFAGAGVYSVQYSGSPIQLYCRLRSVFVPSVNPNSDDFDDDGISNLDELQHSPFPLDPLNADTDGDGFSDGVERDLLLTNPSIKDHAITWNGDDAIILTPTL